MLQLNGIDLIMEFLFIDDEFDEDFYKALLCVKKLIGFMSYKQNKKTLNENLERYKFKIESIEVGIVGILTGTGKVFF